MSEKLFTCIYCDICYNIDDEHCPKELIMRKIIYVSLSVLLIFALSVTALALPLSAGTDALDNCFIDGEAPKGYDYVAFSPKKGDDDTTKYPLMVWLHGMKSGTEKRAQLKWYEFSNWASDEYQARFANAGGCYLLAVRASDESINSWTSNSCYKLMRTIEYYLSLNGDNIDTSRIYIGGYSTGGSAVWDMISQYDGYFAAAVPIAAIYLPTTQEMDKVTDTSIWMFASDNDPYEINQSDDAYERFNYLKTRTLRPEGLRITTVSDARFADNSKRYNLETFEIMWDAEHFIWEAVTYDMHLMDGVTPYPNCTTIDAAGNTIDFSDPSQGVISWLSLQTNDPTPVQESDDTGFFAKIAAFFKSIINWFKTLFKIS